MRSRRPYKDPEPDELIIKMLREKSDTSFNPRLVENFLRLIKS
jgi:response regulator RpfG family c-di-GMP phosphodiesterase